VEIGVLLRPACRSPRFLAQLWSVEELVGLLEAWEHAGMESLAKLNRKKAALVLLLPAAFVLGIPSLPLKPYHLLFWAIALLLELLVIFLLWPLEQNSN